MSLFEELVIIFFGLKVLRVGIFWSTWDDGMQKLYTLRKYVNKLNFVFVEKW